VRPKAALSHTTLPTQVESLCVDYSGEGRHVMSEIEHTVSDPDLESMERYGIKRTTADYYHYGQYRYTNLKDAIAQAERDKHKSV
jgi:hypothetical protein